MIKILILLAIIALTTYVGVFLSAEKKKRAQVYAELYEFNERLLLNMKFNKYPVEQVAEGFKYVEKILQGGQVLQGSDNKTINDYFASLGTSDALSQIDYLNDRKAALSRLKDESFSDYKRYSSLYIKIFFMVGVLIAVLLV